MAINRDFEDLLHCFNGARAKYLVVGAYAVIFYTEPRYTKDLDLWIQPTPDNARRVYQALKRFGAPLKHLTVEDLTKPTMVYQIGIEPNRIDILMGISHVSFDHAWRHRRVTRYGKETMYVLHRADLLRAKQGTGRLQDQLDLQLLATAPRHRHPQRPPRQSH